MPILLNDFVKEVLDAPCYGFIGAINEFNQPVITRFFGFKYDDPLTTLTFYTFKKDAQRVVDQLKDGVKLAATTSNAMDYKTVQFKGTYLRHYDVRHEELNYARQCNAKQAKIIEMFGISNEIWANWSFEPSLAIAINVEELFDQTPKINTGKKIN